LGYDPCHGTVTRRPAPASLLTEPGRVFRRRVNRRMPSVTNDYRRRRRRRSRACPRAIATTARATNATSPPHGVASYMALLPGEVVRSHCGRRIAAPHPSSMAWVVLHRPGYPSAARIRGARARRARPRWLSASFCSAVISAVVRV